MCEYCEIQHNFDPDLGDKVYFFLDSNCHHIETTCPNCGTQSTVYAPEWEQMWYLLVSCLTFGITITMVRNTDPETRHGYEEAIGRSQLEDAISSELESMFMRHLPELEAGDDLP